MGDGFELVGMAVAAMPRLVPAAVSVAAEIPFQVSGDDQVEMAVAIVIDEAGGHGPAAARNARGLRDIGERSVAVVPV